MRRAVLTLTLAIVSSIAGLTAAAAQERAPIDLTLMTSYGPNQSRGVVLKRLIDQFNADHVGKIQITIQVNPDHPAMLAKLRTMIAAGSPPDIFHYNFNPYDLAIPRSAAVFDFAPYMDAAWRSRFNPDDLARFTVDAKLKSLPFQQSPVMFFYNKALFKKAGISQFPRTWNELLADCQAFQKMGTACMSLFTKADAWHASNALTYAAACIGGLNVFSGSLDSPAIANAFAVVRKLFAFGTKDAVGASYDVSSKNFLLGQTAMVIDGPWAIGPMLDQFKDGQDIGVAKAPSCDDAKAPSGFIVTDAPSPMAAGRQSEPGRADAIVAWFKFFTSSESADLFAREGSQPVAFKQTVDPSKVNPIFAVYLAASGDAPGKVISAPRVLRPAAQAALPAVFEGLALDQLTAQQAARQLQDANE